MVNRKQLSYSAEMVRSRNNDAFLSSLFIPAQTRESALAAHALNLELESIHHLVSEEMIGHIRYAWWEESLQVIMNHNLRREHPVIHALPDSVIGECMKLVDHYRSAYPVKPSYPQQLLHDITLALIRAENPQAEAAWLKANAIIDNHRKKFGAKAGSWLKIKLLAAGVF